MHRSFSCLTRYSAINLHTWHSGITVGGTLVLRGCGAASERDCLYTLHSGLLLLDLCASSWSGWESLQSTVAAWWWLESFICSYLDAYFSLKHPTVTMLHAIGIEHTFWLISTCIVLVFPSYSFDDEDLDSWSSSSNPIHHSIMHENSQALPQTVWETTAATDQEWKSAASA